MQKISCSDYVFDRVQLARRVDAAERFHFHIEKNQVKLANVFMIPAKQAFTRGKLEELSLPAIDFQCAFQGVLEQQAGVGVIVAESNAEHVITFLTNICLYFIIGGQRRETKVDSKTTVLDNRRWACAKNDKKTTAFDSAVGSQ